jgi:hypothetical protein
MLTESIDIAAQPPTVAESFAGVTVAFAGNVTQSSFIPAFIPADQAYFWSIPWQDAERRALADIASGRTRTFADPTAAVRYLLGGEPE